MRTTYNGPQLTLSSVSGGLFDLVSLDFAEFSTPAAYYSPTVKIRGNKADGSVITTTMQADRIIDGHGYLDDFETISFTDFTNLLSVDLIAPTDGYSVDNIVVESVPEPTTLILLVTGLAVLYTNRRVIRKNTISA